jgi:hypothetical protein
MSNRSKIASFVSFALSPFGLGRPWIQPENFDKGENTVRKTRRDIRARNILAKDER